MLAFVMAMPCSLCAGQAAQQHETKGVCSPIALDNHGSITINCSGFSDKQYRVLRDFLGQLSSDQAKQQDLLLSRIDEILDALRKQATEAKPRVIPDSDLQLIANAAWGQIPVSNVHLIAPAGDVEAENLAKQIAGVFRRGGMNVEMGYKPIRRGSNDPDLLVIRNATNAMCVTYLLVGTTFARQISVKSEQIAPPANITDKAAIDKFQFDSSVPLTIVVFPRAAE